MLNKKFEERHDQKFDSSLLKQNDRCTCKSSLNTTGQGDSSYGALDINLTSLTK